LKKYVICDLYFWQTYVHGALRSRSVRVLRPFLTFLFCMLSLLCGLVKLGIGSSHWTDIAAGFATGSFIALYLVNLFLCKPLISLIFSFLKAIYIYKRTYFHSVVIWFSFIAKIQHTFLNWPERIQIHINCIRIVWKITFRFILNKIMLSSMFRCFQCWISFKSYQIFLNFILENNSKLKKTFRSLFQN
jgi:hypothetical protein